MACKISEEHGMRDLFFLPDLCKAMLLFRTQFELTNSSQTAKTKQVLDELTGTLGVILRELRGGRQPEHLGLFGCPSG